MPNIIDQLDDLTKGFQKELQSFMRSRGYQYKRKMTGAMEQMSWYKDGHGDLHIDGWHGNKRHYWGVGKLIFTVYYDDAEGKMVNRDLQHHDTRDDLSSWTEKDLEAYRQAWEAERALIEEYVDHQVIPNRRSYIMRIGV